MFAYQILKNITSIYYNHNTSNTNIHALLTPPHFSEIYTTVIEMYLKNVYFH